MIYDKHGRFLLAQRPAGKPYAGYWEFPGGKVERGESAASALARELHEELGIEDPICLPWLTRDFDYAHAAVRLRFFRVPTWSGHLHARESQQFAWQTIDDVTVAPLLPANGPILRALQLPSVYGITSMHTSGREPFMTALKRALETGLRFVQVREKQLDPRALTAFTADVVALCRPHGARVVVNGPVEVAATAGADGIHLTSSHLLAATSRPDCAWCGASCHTREELKRALELGVDFVVLGPVKATPTHPDAQLLGWAAFATLAKDYPVPVYALGGLVIDDLDEAWANGAHGVAMVRGAWSGTARVGLSWNGRRYGGAASSGGKSTAQR